MLAGNTSEYYLDKFVIIYNTQLINVGKSLKVDFNLSAVKR